MPCDPKPPGVVLDDASADCQPHSETAWLRGVKRGEDRLHALGGKPHSGIANGHHHVALIIDLRADDQITGAAMDGGHRINGVQNQVEEDLLQLHPVS